LAVQIEKSLVVFARYYKTNEEKFFFFISKLEGYHVIIANDHAIIENSHMKNMVRERFGKSRLVVSTFRF
jgi:hypothetical protein